MRYFAFGALVLIGSQACGSSKTAADSGIGQLAEGTPREIIAAFFTAIKNDDHETLERVLVPRSYQYLKRSEQLQTFLTHWGRCKVQGVGDTTEYYRAEPGEDKALKIWIDMNCPKTGYKRERISLAQIEGSWYIKVR